MTLPVLTYVREEFAQRKAKNSRYSVRSFAQALGISSSALTQILTGKRKLTFTTACRIFDRLEVADPQRNALLMTFDNSKAHVPPLNNHRLLTEQELEALAGWQFYAILCVLELPGRSFTDRDIAARLACDLNCVQASIELLLVLGLVRKEAERYVPTGEQLTTSHNIPSPALVKAHKDYLCKATEALSDCDTRKESDFSGITMAISKKKLPEASRRIREFRRSLATYLCDNANDEVYRINIQLFPLTRIAARLRQD